MKHYITLVVLLVTINFSFGQSKNQERIDELTSLIEQAVEKGDYDQAAKLKEEKTIRLDIEKALADQDYDKAEQLKDKLSNLDKKEESVIKEEKKEETLVRKEEPKNETNARDENTDRSSGKDYIFKRGFALDALLQFYPAYSGIGGAVQIANKWYFGSHAKFRPGFQVLWGRIGVVAARDNPFGWGSTAIPTIAPANVGFTGALKFSENMGLEANLNMGVIIFNEYIYSSYYVSDFYYDSFGNYVDASYYANDWDEELSVGFNIGPAVKFRYKALALGVDYRVIPVASVLTSRKSLISINFGFKW